MNCMNDKDRWMYDDLLIDRYVWICYDVDEWQRRTDVTRII